MHEEKQYYPALTGIRAIAAWMVFIHHFNPFSEQVFGKHIHNFFAEMHIGVTLFFVLSGLLLTLRYYDHSITSGRSFYNYMVKRAARIYPFFLVIVTINFIWLINTGVFDKSFNGGWVYYLGTISFLRGFFADFPAVPVQQSWSLTAEECFYLLCPFIFFLLRKNIKQILILPVLFILFGLAVTFFFIQHPFYGFFKDLRFFFNYIFFGRCIEFFAGIAAGLIFKKIGHSVVSNYRYTVIGSAVIIFSLIALSLFHTPLFHGDHHPVGILINNLLLPVFGIAVLYYGLLTEKNLISKWLGSRWMVLLGKSSYVFYLIHIGIFATLFIQYVSAKPVIVFVYLNILSVILYKLIEHPLNGFIRRKLLKKEKI